MKCENLLCALCDRAHRQCVVGKVDCEIRKQFTDLVEAIKEDWREVGNVGSKKALERISLVAPKPEDETCYKVKSRFYAEADNFGESYVIQSDNSGKDTRLDIGQAVTLKVKK